MHQIQQYSPSGQRQHTIDALWISTPAQGDVNRVLPDGCTDLIIQVTAGQPVVSFVGPMTTAIQVPLPQDDYFVGIRFQPGVLLKPLAHSLVDLRDQSQDMTPDEVAALGLMLPQYDLSPLNLLDRLDQWAARLIRRGALLRDPLITEAIRRLQADPTLRIQSLYEDLALSPRALERRFLKMLGLPPKVFARIQRHQRAAHELASSQAMPTLAALAQDLAYADQAHFIRDFNALAGITPGDYRLEAQK